MSANGNDGNNLLNSDLKYFQMFSEADESQEIKKPIRAAEEED